MVDSNISYHNTPVNQMSHFDLSFTVHRNLKIGTSRRVSWMYQKQYNLSKHFGFIIDLFWGNHAVYVPFGIVNWYVITSIRYTIQINQHRVTYLFK